MQATQLELGPILSSNGYFVVREGRYFGKDVAVKKPVPECRHPYVGYEFRHEIELLLSLPAHRNIVSCHGTVHAGADVTLVLEKADMSMNSLLCDHDFVLDWRIRGKLALDVARGLQHLHHYGFLHGDLKSGNVLVFLGESDEDITAKLCDFGMCRRTSDTSVHSGVPHSCGTLEWSAPETLTSEDTANLAYTYTAASEVYSLGVLLWELAARHVPFMGLDAVTVYRAIVREDRRPSIPPDTPLSLARLIRDCWQRDPQRRPSVSAVVHRLQLFLDEICGHCSSSSSSDSP